MLSSYRDRTVDDPPQVEADVTVGAWDNNFDYGTVGRQYNVMGFRCVSFLCYSHVSSHVLPSAQQLGLFYPTRIHVLPRKVLFSTSKEFLFRSAGIHSQKWQGLSSLICLRRR